MMRIIQAFFLWMLLGLVACKGSPGFRVSEFKEVKFDELPEDIKIPSQAWDLLAMKPAQGEVHGGAHGEASTVSSSNIIFSEVNVFLVSKNPGVVADEAVKILLSKGGGTVDLAQFISDKRGSFYVGFEFPDMEGADAKKVLFLSGARKRRIGEQVFGAGCNQFFDITEQFIKAMKTEGLKVNTTQDRYISVLGGTFLFTAQKGKNIHVAQVTFRHSEHKPLFCKEHQ